mmetsp:Transcript_17418/g.48094  ORF Transcript_17418/g.48094 Transcript_17418/m.48094 type:complete len:439 (+) Transcript_17418:229-1545(+)
MRCYWTSGWDGAAANHTSQGRLRYLRIQRQDPRRQQLPLCRFVEFRPNYYGVGGCQSRNRSGRKFSVLLRRSANTCLLRQLRRLLHPVGTLRERQPVCGLSHRSRIRRCGSGGTGDTPQKRTEHGVSTLCGRRQGIRGDVFRCLFYAVFDPFRSTPKNAGGPVLCSSRGVARRVSDGAVCIASRGTVSLCCGMRERRATATSQQLRHGDCTEQPIDIDPFRGRWSGKHDGANGQVVGIVAGGRGGGPNRQGGRSAIPRMRRGYRQAATSERWIFHVGRDPSLGPRRRLFHHCGSQRRFDPAGLLRPTVSDGSTDRLWVPLEPAHGSRLAEPPGVDANDLQGVQDAGLRPDGTGHVEQVGSGVQPVVFLRRDRHAPSHVRPNRAMDVAKARRGRGRHRKCGAPIAVPARYGTTHGTNRRGPPTDTERHNGWKTRLDCWR